MGSRRITRMVAAGITAGLALLLAVSGCESDAVGPGPSEPITELPRALSSSEQLVIRAGNSFAVDLLGRVHAAAPDSTVFLSPLSASMALGMTMNGATGVTQDQMRSMLGFGSLSMSEVNQSYRDLIALLRELDPRVEVLLANAIFHRSSFQMEAPFLETVSTYFDGRAQGLDFNDPSAANTINAWVRQSTKNRIDKMVDPPIDPLTMAYLMNAVYFKGDWTKEFDPDDTYQGPFHPPSGPSRTVDFMQKEDSLRFRASSSWQAVEIPYGGGAWVMTVAVPNEGRGLGVVASDLRTLLDPAATWNERVMEIHIPRFELEWERLLNDDLKALGMIDAFSPSAADFTPMYAAARQVQLHVKSVKQKTFLKVDERGTEAAAVTSVEVGVTSLGPGPFKADRPFLLAIRERLSGTVLFAGFIVQAPIE